MLVLRDLNGFRWESVPKDVRNALQILLEELRSHKHTIEEPSISNIAAVASAIARLGADANEGRKWVVALETILLIVSNITRNPRSARYYKLNTSNAAFNQKIGRVERAIGNIIPLSSLSH